jgi:archaellum component FlaC
MVKKNITLNQLAEKMDKGFTAVDKKFDDFGIMVKNGFDDAQKGMNARFEKVDNSIAELKRDMEEVKLKFAYTAWAIDVEELKKRVIALEKKAGVKKFTPTF